MKEVKYCSHCGAKMVQYPHKMNKLLVRGLKKLYESGGGPINIRELKMHRTIWDNFQKLRYWELVEKCYDDSKKRLGGTWAITSRGIEFLEGKRRVFDTVWTYRGMRVRYAGNKVLVDKVDETIFLREDYRTQAEVYKEV